MGGSKKYNPNGGFTEQGYVQTGTTANNIKIIEQKGKNRNYNTPLFSNTPNTMYAKTDVKSGLIEQISVYGNGNEKREKLKDIDIGHSHTNPDKKFHFGANDIHIHAYKEGVRSTYARKPSKKEKHLLMVARYGKRVK